MLRVQWTNLFGKICLARNTLTGNCLNRICPGRNGLRRSRVKSTFYKTVSFLGPDFHIIILIFTD